MKLWTVLATAQSSSELCLLLNVAMAWGHPRSWQSSVAVCKFTRLIFRQVFQRCQRSTLCNSQVGVRAFGRSFVLSVLRLRDLMPFKPCRRLVLFSAKLLLPHTHFHSFNNPLQRDSPTSASCPSGRPINISKLAKHFCSSCCTSVPHADDNLTQTDVI